MPKIKVPRQITARLKAEYVLSPISRQKTMQDRKAASSKISKRTASSTESKKSDDIQEAKNSVPDLMRAISKIFEAHKNPGKAGPMKKYMRNKFDFIGLMTAERRELTKQVLATRPVLSDQEIQQLLIAVWQRNQREFQYFGVDCASKYVKTLIGSDLQTCLKSLTCIQTLITSKSWWDTVDLLASKVVGPMVKGHPKELGAVMDKWISDSNMWLRRTAILHQLGYKGATDQAKLFRYCKLCCHEEEFFIQKAIGWALRQYFRENPKAVKDFVNQNKKNLAKLSIKEALKHA
ncbi:hypothetical protein ScPMuIL_013923 [Solemya velum]